MWHIINIEIIFSIHEIKFFKRGMYLSCVAILGSDILVLKRCIRLVKVEDNHKLTLYPKPFFSPREVTYNWWISDLKSI